MNDAETPGPIVNRLRTNLKSAGISLAEAEIDQMIAGGMLRNAVAFEELDARTDSETVPDYLGTWEPVTAGRTSPGPLLSGSTAPAAPSMTDGYPRLMDVAARLRSREVSSVELTQQSLNAIRARDPSLNAFQLVLADEALAAARQAEREIAGGAYRGPLHGIPVAVKDLVAMAGTPTTAGSRIIAEFPRDADAAAVARLKTAGAVIVGKTRMPEFAYSPGSNNPNYGPTRNPWKLTQDTGGSSSGSGAAVAAGLVFAALGSDTGGSIRIPASLCGVIGLKPTFGRISLHGAVTLSWSLDHLGPLTRGVADAAAVFEALAGPDPRDPRTRFAASRPAEAPKPIRRLRVGVLHHDGTNVPLGTEETLAAWKAGLATLERAGAALVELDLPEVRDLRVVNGAILAIEALAFHQERLRTRLSEFGPFARQRLLAGYAYAPNAIVRAQQARATLRRRCDAIFDTVDLLSTPTMPGGAPELGALPPTVFTGPFNCLGWPAISVPVGLTADGLPLGLQLTARPWHEATLLRAAATIERRGPWRAGRP